MVSHLILKTVYKVKYAHFSLDHIFTPYTRVDDSLYLQVKFIRYNIMYGQETKIYHEKELLNRVFNKLKNSNFSKNKVKSILQRIRSLRVGDIFCVMNAGGRVY